MHTVKKIIFESLLIVILSIYFHSIVCDFVCKTLLSHSKIINDQSQILIHTIKMLQFRPHLVCLLIEFLNFYFSWPNISFQFLNLIVKNKFELFKLLSFLFQLIYSMIFILYCIFSLLDFLFLSINLQLSHCNLLYYLSHECLLLVYLSNDLFFVSFCFLKEVYSLSE